MESSPTGRQSQPTTTIFIQDSNDIVRTAALAIMAVLLFYTGVVVTGVICSVACILSATSNKGLEVDTRARDYRIFTSVAGFKIGDWEPLPEAHSITMKFYAELFTSTRTTRVTLKDGRYIIMFSIPDSSQGVIIYQASTYKAAKHLTEALAQVLGIEAKIYNKFGQLE
ncbi:hypothetical protein J0X19_16715 [Hymenobacter sp. BT186]|uniref:Uncharacterized protein n=1 Tax=Hymenobacter telluris TaxID=2816474 RepID=A0A939JA83_9BACT|nr:hypothetical protein [Hymenobacter telluris]MBO0359604.1 hypothetical protein [Hymenobacter telluris]MBW3375631.1 hypothetical protein [Hymenobacter norwichensis]